MSLFSKVASNLSGPKSSTRSSEEQYVTWRCRYCGMTTTTRQYYTPGSGVGGACRVVGGKSKPHEWMKER